MEAFMIPMCLPEEAVFFQDSSNMSLISERSRAMIYFFFLLRVKSMITAGHR